MWDPSEICAARELLIRLRRRGNTRALIHAIERNPGVLATSSGRPILSRLAAEMQVSLGQARAAMVSARTWLVAQGLGT